MHILVYNSYVAFCTLWHDSCIVLYTSCMIAMQLLVCYSYVVLYTYWCVIAMQLYTPIGVCVIAVKKSLCTSWYMLAMQLHWYVITMYLYSGSLCIHKVTLLPLSMMCAFVNNLKRFLSKKIESKMSMFIMPVEHIVLF